MKVQIKTTQMSFKIMAQSLKGFCEMFQNTKKDMQQMTDYENICAVSQNFNSRTYPANPRKQIQFTIDHNKILSLHRYHEYIGAMHELNALLLAEIFKEARKISERNANIEKARIGYG